VFAIGVSHGVQMINAVGKEVRRGMSVCNAAQLAFVSLALPGGIALLSDTVGFLTLLVIDIGIIRELAITASLGVAVIIMTNLILLPVLISFVTLGDKFKGRFIDSAGRADKYWQFMSRAATPKVAVYILAVSLGLFAWGFYQ